MNSQQKAILDSFIHKVRAAKRAYTRLERMNDRSDTYRDDLKIVQGRIYGLEYGLTALQEFVRLEDEK